MSGRKIYEVDGDGMKIELWGAQEGDPEFYVDGIHGIQQTEIAVKVNFYSLAIDSTDTLQRRETVCRLVMSKPQFLQMSKFLYEYGGKIVADLQRQAAASPLPPAAPESETPTG